MPATHRDQLTIASPEFESESGVWPKSVLRTICALMKGRFARSATPLLLLAAGLVVLALAVGGAHTLLFHSRPLGYFGLILLMLGGVGLGLSFLARAAAWPPGSERNRYAGVGFAGLLAALAIWLRDFEHLGPRGNWLWLILLVLVGVMAVLLWKDLDGQGASRV
jgi:hypothetical protein